MDGVAGLRLPRRPLRALAPRAAGVAGLLLTLGDSAPAPAHPEYQREFQKLYAGGGDKDFRRLVRQAKCNVCHQGKKDKKNYNAYGLALCDLLIEEDRKDKEKIVAALKEVASAPSSAEEAGAPTFGERIERGELPAGPLEESKTEPPAEAE